VEAVLRGDRAGTDPRAGHSDSSPGQKVAARRAPAHGSCQRPYAESCSDCRPLHAAHKPYVCRPPDLGVPRVTTSSDVSSDSRPTSCVFPAHCGGGDVRAGHRRHPAAQPHGCLPRRRLSPTTSGLRLPGVSCTPSACPQPRTEAEAARCGRRRAGAGTRPAPAQGPIRSQFTTPREWTLAPKGNQDGTTAPLDHGHRNLLPQVRPCGAGGARTHDRGIMSAFPARQLAQG
jgi:hypothetical protein